MTFKVASVSQAESSSHRVAKSIVFSSGMGRVAAPASQTVRTARVPNGTGAGGNGRGPYLQ